MGVCTRVQAQEPCLRRRARTPTENTTFRSFSVRAAGRRGPKGIRVGACAVLDVAEVEWRGFDVTRRARAARRR